MKFLKCKKYFVLLLLLIKYVNIKLDFNGKQSNIIIIYDHAMVSERIFWNKIYLFYYYFFARFYFTFYVCIWRSEHWNKKGEM